jgi:two-component system phosphate regulon response regulator PhoB
MMPGVNGFEVLRRLKGDPILRAVPVIMVTAKGHERDVLSGLRGGAVDYVVKPFSLKELSARVELALRREPPATAS